MLVGDPKYRISMKDIMHHDWITSHKKRLFDSLCYQDDSDSNSDELLVPEEKAPAVPIPERKHSRPISLSNI